MEDNSPEYRTLIDLTSELGLAVRSNLISLSGALLSARLISPDNDTELRNKFHIEADRAARLVELVQNKVRQNFRHYYTFVGILRGTPGQYSDILQKLDRACAPHQEEDSPRSTSADVRSRINDLECQFRGLHGKILTELEEKRTSISKLQQSLTLLPTEIRQEYRPAITKIFPDLRKETTISGLFCHLGPLVDFLGYDLLKYIVDAFGSDTLKVRMHTYSEDITKFMKETTIKQLMNIWPGEQEIPPNFSNLRAKIDDDPTTYTLYELDQLRRRFCSRNKLTDVVLVFIGLESANSFIAEWLIPSTLIPHLMESARNLDYGFYLHERILKMTVDGKQIFPFLPDSKPKVPALQAAAATAVTELGKEKELSDVPAPLLPLSMEHLRLSPAKVRQLQRFSDQLSDCALYSGVAVVFHHWMRSPRLERALSELNYKLIKVDLLSVDLKTVLSTIVQSKAYPKPPRTGSHSFVITIFVRAIAFDSTNLLFSVFRQEEISIVDDIIKPFLPQSAPHLAHIPKLFFIGSNTRPLGKHPDMDTQPPLFPTDPDANYCVAYLVANKLSTLDEWTDYIADNLSSIPVQDIVENYRAVLDRNYDCLHFFSCLKDKL